MGWWPDLERLLPSGSGRSWSGNSVSSHSNSSCTSNCSSAWPDSSGWDRRCSPACHLGEGGQASSSDWRTAIPQNLFDTENVFFLLEWVTLTTPAKLLIWCLTFVVCSGAMAIAADDDPLRRLRSCDSSTMLPWKTAWPLAFSLLSFSQLTVCPRPLVTH